MRSILGLAVRDLRGRSSGPERIQKALCSAIHRSKPRICRIFSFLWPRWPRLPDLNKQCALRFEIANLRMCLRYNWQPGSCWFYWVSLSNDVSMFTFLIEYGWMKKQQFKLQYKHQHFFIAWTIQMILMIDIIDLGWSNICQGGWC